jgi:hypothetical protein
MIMVFEHVSPYFIYTMHFIMSFAFINIHLDIYRIIIPHKKISASTMRKDFEEGNFYASLCTKRRESVFAFGSKKKFRPQQSRLYTVSGNKIYYKVCTNLHKFSIMILQKSLQNFCRKEYCSNYQASGHHISDLSIFSFVILQLRHPTYIEEQNKVQILRRR